MYLSREQVWYSRMYKSSVHACISPALASAAFFTSRRFLGFLLTGKTATVKPQPSSLRPEVAVDDCFLSTWTAWTLFQKVSVSHKQGERRQVTKSDLKRHDFTGLTTGTGRISRLPITQRQLILVPIFTTSV
jgi:hypothetical protein